MISFLPLIAVMLAGIGVAVQAPTNAMLARASGSVLLASLMSFAGGTAILLSLWLAFDRTSPATLKSVPGWAWLGGLYGAGFVAAVAFAAPRLGLATTLTVAIATQVATALALDHLGWFGLKADPVSATKIAGAVLMLAGVVAIRRG